MSPLWHYLEWGDSIMYVHEWQSWVRFPVYKELPGVTHTKHKVHGVTLLVMFTLAPCWISFLTVPILPFLAARMRAVSWFCTEFNNKGSCHTHNFCLHVSYFALHHPIDVLALHHSISIAHLHWLCRGTWWCMVVRDRAWKYMYMVVHGTAWWCMVVHGSAW